MINYENLHKSTLFYEEKGYKRIESPWTVTEAIIDITKPFFVNDKYKIETKRKCLVASAEQSFLYLYLKGFLPKGKFQSITPCFRDEIFDQTHSKYFIKNELIVTDNVTEEQLQKVIGHAYNFFCEMFPEKENFLKIKTIETNRAYDIEFKGIALGSYGIRECDYLSWIYATGCAEPRLSYCQNLK